MIIIHVLLALGALSYSALANIKPTNLKLKASYTLAGGTLTTGVLLIVLHNASILRTCATGIAFFAVVSVLNETARRKLASVISE